MGNGQNCVGPHIGCARLMTSWKWAKSVCTNCSVYEYAPCTSSDMRRTAVVCSFPFYLRLMGAWLQSSALLFVHHLRSSTSFCAPCVCTICASTCLGTFYCALARLFVHRLCTKYNVVPDNHSHRKTIATSTERLWCICSVPPWDPPSKTRSSKIEWHNCTKNP